MMRTLNKQTANRRSIFVDPETYDRLNALACQNGRSIVGQVRFMLDHYVEIHQIQPTPDAEPVPYVDVKETK